MATTISSITSPSLSICDLGRIQVRAALNVDMSALINDDLSVPQAWGLALQQHPAYFQGIRFISRFTTRPCLALFNRDRIKNALTEKALRPLAKFDAALVWLEKYQIQLI